jgi:dihydroorotase
MKVLFKDASIVQQNGTTGPLHVLVENGVITYIGSEEVPADRLVASPHLHLSPGWLDARCYTNDPGFDAKDDLKHIKLAGLAGGFTDVVCLPNTRPAIQSKDVCSYFVQHSNISGFKFHPLGAATVDLKGDYLTEYIDLHFHGAVGFTDGDAPITQPDVVIRALEYLLPINGLLIQHATDPRLARNGQIHEGQTSILTGLRGIPSIAETTFIQQQIALTAYTGGKMHISGISTAEGCEHIRVAKSKGIRITCDMPAYQLFFTEEDLLHFDTLRKVWPPFRAKSDRLALLEALQDGTIDCVVSNHHSHDDESKYLEFDLAEFGFGGLQTAFSSLITASNSYLDVVRLVQLFCFQPRILFGLPIPALEVGKQACITAFDPIESWTLTEHTSMSKNLNSPFRHKQLKGKIVATMAGSDVFFGTEVLE